MLLPKTTEKTGIQSENENKNLPIKVAVIGKSNAGKSSLINQLQKGYQLLTHHEKGTTTDTVSLEMNIKGRRVVLVDTPGLEHMKHNKKKFSLRNMITQSAMKTVNECQIVVLVLDAFDCFTQRDTELIHHCVAEGRGLIVMVNKFDLLDKKWHTKAQKYMKQQLDIYAGEKNTIPLFFISAKEGTGIKPFYDTLLQVYEKWNARISTGLLNDWLQKMKKITENDYKSFIKK